MALAYEGKADAVTAFVSAIAAAVRANRNDPAFAALLTRLPDVGELFLEHIPANPRALSDARDLVQRALATELAADAKEILATPSPSPFKPDAEQSGARALRTAMITLVGATGGEKSDTALREAFEAAPNMTESLACLRALCIADSASTAESIETFAEKWTSNPLVMDKWFAVQASTGSVEDVAKLLEHGDFDLGNPNRVRSVVAVFAMQNLAAFHAPDGAGYRLVTDVICRADAINPALAARLLTAFEQWKSLEQIGRASCRERV